MKREEDEQLWDLLGQAAEPKVSPFFARSVLRKIRQEPRLVTWLRPWLSVRKLIPASTVALALVGAIMATRHPSLLQKPSGAESDLVAKIDAQDYEVVADLDELLASDDNNLWDENSSL